MPESSLVRRYVRCVEAVDDGKSLHFLRSWARFPLGIALLEAVEKATPGQVRLGSRVDMMTVLAEASTQGAKRFIATRHSRLAAFVSIFWACAAEVTLRIGAKFLRPWIVRVLKNVEAMNR
jgi:hypothetical protein